MMTEELKAIFGKKSEELTDDDRKKALEAVDAFKKDVEDVCREHGLAYKSILSVTQEGVAPVLDIVRVNDAPTAKAEGNA